MAGDGSNSPPTLSTEVKTFEGWTEITKNMSNLKTAVEALKGNKTLPDLVIALEKSLDFVAHAHFSLAKTVDERLQVVEKAINISKASGDLPSNIENSAAYLETCEEVKNSALLCKIPQFELETSQSDRQAIINQVKDILAKKNVTLDIKTSVIPLAKASTQVDNKHVIPILIKSPSAHEKRTLEVKLKSAFYNTAHHWPKIILPCIQNMRSQMLAYNKDGQDFTNSQILIRPNPNTGKSLFISYRSAIGAKNKWVSLEQVKTPAPPSLLTTFNEPQVSKSKYFQL